MKFLFSVFKEKCPYCYKDSVFVKGASIFSLPKMKDRCGHCDRKLNGEPGYFLGAMYVSYAIAVAVGVASFVISNYFLNIQSIGIQIGFILTMMLAISFKNFKWSRLIWLKIFPPKSK